MSASQSFEAGRYPFTEPCAWTFEGTEDTGAGILHWWYCEHGKSECGDEDAPSYFPCEYYIYPEEG